MNTLHTALPVLASLVCAGAVFAAPQVETKNKTGSSSSPSAEWDLSYLQLKGDLTTEQVKVNAAIEGLVTQSLRELQTPSQDMEGTEQQLSISMDVGVLSEELLSIEISTYSYFGGAHGLVSQSAITFNLETGEQVPVRAFFAGGSATLTDLAGRVGTALKQDYSSGQGELMLDMPKPEDLSEVLVRPTGLTFLWGSYGLGAPFAMGTIKAELSWNELDGVLYSSGPLRSLLKGSASTVVDLPLGGGASGSSQTSLSADETKYIQALEVQAVNQLTLLDAFERESLSSSSAWRGASSGRELLSTLQTSHSAAASLLKGARSNARAGFPNTNFANLLGHEARAFTNAVDAAMQTLEAGTAAAANLDVLGFPTHAGDTGATIDILGMGERVGVMKRATPADPYHHVRLSTGQFGRIPDKLLAIESVTRREGQVVRDFSGRYTLGEDGLELRASEATPASRVIMDKFASLIGSGEHTTRVSIYALKVDYRGSTWLIPAGLDPASTDGPAGGGAVGGVDPHSGITGELPK